MQPKELIYKWVESFNQGNAEKIFNFYHYDAINHPVSNEPVIGGVAIIEMFENEFNQ
jgi:ketosteroid isomerase-like protein